MVLTGAFLVTLAVFLRQVKANLMAAGDRVDLSNW